MEQNWRTVLSDCLGAFEREQVGTDWPVVDHEVRTAAGGDITVWLICRTDDEQRQFVDRELARAASAIRRRFIAAGVPEAIVDTIQFRVVSRVEVNRRGGYGGLS